MVGCKYCGSTFSSYPEGGVCPNCGGPGLKATAIDMVGIRALSLKNRVYKATGFKAVSAFSWFFTGLLALSVLAIYAVPGWTSALWGINMAGSFILIALNAVMGQTIASMFAALLLFLNFVKA